MWIIVPTNCCFINSKMRILRGECRRKISTGVPTTECTLEPGMPRVNCVFSLTRAARNAIVRRISTPPRKAAPMLRVMNTEHALQAAESQPDPDSHEEVPIRRPLGGRMGALTRSGRPAAGGENGASRTYRSTSVDALRNAGQARGPVGSTAASTQADAARGRCCAGP